MANISQREARRMRRELEALKETIREQRRVWSSDWPGGVNIDQFDADEATAATISTARKLGHAVVCTVSSHKLYFYALPLPELN
jgi:N-acyl-L-homoserine lactone synthetase